MRVHFTAEGILIGFYDDVIHAGQMPAERIINLTDAEYASASADPEGYRVIADTLVVNPTADLPFVPQSVAKLQMKRALEARDLWGAFKIALALDPAAQEEWDLANSIKITDSRVATLALAIGLTDESDITAVFIEAAAL